MGIPNVLDALGLIVDSLTLEGDSQGRIAVDLPEAYDWDRIDRFFEKLDKEELVDFCHCCVNEEVKNNLMKHYHQEYGGEAKYAEEALGALVEKLKQEGGADSSDKKKKKR
jgi:hypothetical protein